MSSKPRKLIYDLPRSFSVEECGNRHYANINEEMSKLDKVHHKGDWILMKAGVVADKREPYRTLRILNRMDINHKISFPGLAGATKYTLIRFSMKHYCLSRRNQYFSY